MIKLKYILLVVVNLVFAFAVAFIVVENRSPKIAYVRTEVLINEYAGTKEILADFNQQKLQWQSNIDTLKLNFQGAVNSYNRDFEKLTDQQRSATEGELARLETQLQSYTQAIAEKVKEEDSRLMEGLINQINSYVKSYGDEHNYDVILGTAMSGTILHGNEGLDITEDLVKELNKKYSGE